MQLKILIIEDELPGRQLLHEYIGKLPHLTIIGECADGFEGYKAISALKPDLVLLDIQMPRVTGLELLELLDENNMPGIIFTTAYEEHAIRAFEVNAIDYLLKPFSFERFEKAIVKAIESKESASTRLSRMLHLTEQPQSANTNTDRIVVKDGAGIHVIPDTTISCIEAHDDYVLICTDDGEFMKKKTLGFYEENLDSALFLRVHRSFVVNIQAISRIEPYSKDAFLAILKNGRKISVSKQGYARLRKVFDF
jgi:two-component system, LytTR family, response regulator